MGKIIARGTPERRDAVVEAPIDVWVHQRRDFKGKIDQTQIVEHEFINGIIFTKLYQHSYMHEV